MVAVISLGFILVSLLFISGRVYGDDAHGLGATRTLWKWGGEGVRIWEWCFAFFCSDDSQVLLIVYFFSFWVDFNF